MEGAFLPEGKTHPRRFFQYSVCVALLSYHSVKQKTIVFPQKKKKKMCEGACFPGLRCGILKQTA